MLSTSLSYAPLYKATTTSSFISKARFIYLTIFILISALCFSGRQHFLLVFDRFQPNNKQETNLVSTSTFSSSPSSSSTMQGNQKGNEMFIEMGRRVNNFGFKLLGRIIESEEDGTNIMIAPGSVFDVLTIVRLGATINGVVDHELDQVMGGEFTGFLDGMFKEKGKGIDVRIANGVFVTGLIKEGWKKQVVKMGGEADQLKGVDAVNEWVKGKTQGNIKEVLSGIDPQTLCIAVNAVYFKGMWKTVFDEKATMEGLFQLGDAKNKKILFMNRHSRNILYGEWQLNENGAVAQAVELPYGEEGTYSAVVIVSRGKPISHVIEHLDKGGPVLWDKWMSRLHPRDVKLGLPKFKVEYGVRSLVQDLKKMGVRAAFDGSRNGMFLRMSDRNDVFVSELAHKTLVEVSEQGTKASAATVAVLQMRSLPPPPINMRVDRPFLFAIRNKQSGALLFLGRIEEPL